MFIDPAVSGSDGRIAYSLICERDERGVCGATSMLPPAGLAIEAEHARSYNARNGRWASASSAAATAPAAAAAEAGLRQSDSVTERTFHLIAAN